MEKRSILILAFLILFAGCLLQSEKQYYDVYLNGAWGSEDSMVYCQNPGSRTYISFGDGPKFNLTTRFPDYVSVMEGFFSQEKEKIRIQWDTSTGWNNITGCYTKTCNISGRVYEKCYQLKDSATINKDGRISFRNSLFTRIQ